MPRRGRKRLNVTREPNGQPSRRFFRQEDPRMAVAVRRMRQHGLSLEDAMSSLSDTVHGRMLLLRRIGREQFEACERYAVLWRRLVAVIGAPVEPRSAAIGERLERGHDNADTSEEDAETLRGWRDVLRQLDGAGSIAQTAVHEVVVEQMPAEGYRGLNFRVGVDGLVRLWGLTTKRERAT